MRQLLFSALAQSDIADIWQYTEQTWGPVQAGTYNRLIEGACLSLADGTQPGLSAEYIRSGYRKLPVGKHMIYFRTNETTIDVVRILHQRMDVEEHLA